MVRVKEQQEPSEDSAFIADARAFVRLREHIKALTKERDSLRDRLSDAVTSDGTPDETGSLWLELPEDIDGIVALKRERRVSQRLDLEAADELLTSRGLKGRCYDMVPTLNQDEVMQCLLEGELTEEDIDKMFPSAVSWAFVPSKTR